MKIKIFTTDSKGNIVLNKKELEEILNEAYWEGYNNGKKYYNINYPYVTTPYYTWTSTGTGGSSITLCSDTDSTVTTACGTSINASDYTTSSDVNMKGKY